MKHRFLLFLLAGWFITGITLAQPANGHAGQQARHYAEIFGLNEAQTVKFTELYQTYNRKLHAIHTLYQQERPAEGVELTDEQIEKRIQDNFTQTRAILEVREQYYREFRSFLTPKQINIIFEDEKARRAQMQKKNQ